MASEDNDLTDDHQWSVSDNLDVMQCYVSFHLHLCDALQLLHSVFVVQQVAPIYCHFELLGVTKNDDLPNKQRSVFITHCVSDMMRQSLLMSDLKVASSSKRGGASTGLLGAPAAPQERVPDEDSFL